MSPDMTIVVVQLYGIKHKGEGGGLGARGVTSPPGRVAGESAPSDVVSGFDFELENM